MSIVARQESEVCMTIAFLPQDKTLNVMFETEKNNKHNFEVNLINYV